MPPNGHPHSNGHVNGYDDMDSNGVDSGQGSSLDRDYSSYNGHAQYSSAQAGAGRERYGGGAGVWQGAGQDRAQYYYNLPHRQQQPPEQEAGGGAQQTSPRRRAPGDTLDLTNREYRGSAFELYKKPGYSIPASYQQDVPR